MNVNKRAEHSRRDLLPAPANTHRDRREFPSLDPVDIDQLVSDIVRDIRGIAERMGIDVVAANASTSFVKANAGDLRHALVLLLTALLECTRRGGTIRLSFHDLKGWVDLSVHATTCPLPPELLEAFAESAWVDGRTGGSGTRIFHDVKTIVQSMDGHVRVSGGNAAETAVILSLDMAVPPHVPRIRRQTWWSAAIRLLRENDMASLDGRHPDGSVAARTTNAVSTDITQL